MFIWLTCELDTCSLFRLQTSARSKSHQTFKQFRYINIISQRLWPFKPSCPSVLVSLPSPSLNKNS